MFNLSSLQAKKPEEGYRQLSASSDNLHLQDDSVIFSVADDDDDDEERRTSPKFYRPCITTVLSGTAVISNAKTNLQGQSPEA